jgi:hypothetical protein
MIKFFRKIRQKMLTENKISKYLMYAIGEIILVVIGILIALQINNWNENRKSALQETLYLKRLLSENNEDINTFKKNISSLEKGIETIKNLALALNATHTEDEELISATNAYFGFGSIYPVFSSSTSTFDDLSSTGNLKEIRNLKLRDQLVKHYARHKQIAEWISVGTQWALPIDAPFTFNNNAMKFEPVSAFLFGEQSSIRQAQHLRDKKEEYLNNVAVHFWLNTDAIKNFKGLMEDTLVIINLIEKELNNH